MTTSPSLPHHRPVVVGGVDTHKDLHLAAVVDSEGHVLATAAFSTTRAGYRALLRCMHTHGDVARVGVECTGSYGAGLLRHLEAAGVEVLEVMAGDRADRRRRGKNDTIDASERRPCGTALQSAPSPRRPAMG